MRSATRVVALVACLLGTGVVASAASAATDPGTTGDPGQNQPSGVTVTTGRGDAARPGTVKSLKYELGPLRIEPGQNLIETSTFRIPQPEEDGWIVGFRPNLELEDGTTPPVDRIHLHHGVWANGARLDRTALFPERFFAAGEEKSYLEMPLGYGYPYRTTDYWFLNYMIHNLTPERYTLSITYEVDFVPVDDPPVGGVRPVYPVWLDVENGSFYPVFDVLKGAGTAGRFTYPDDVTDPYAGGPAKNEWTVDTPGVLVHTFGHLHPGGLSIDLSLRRPGARAAPGSPAAKDVEGDTARLFSSTAKYYEPAGAVSWDVSMTATREDWRVAVRPGDVLRLSATYDTSRASWYESMGLAVVWMSEGVGGADPFTTRVNKPGELTHGHLPENDNHGGNATPKRDPRKAGNGEVTAAVDIGDFLYSAGDLTLAGDVPTVPAGGAITFQNLDADALRVWHSVTACKAPCTKSTGIAYPLADADVQFDSGQLGDAGAPTVGRLTWSTPTDLVPGTYTYFCRVHPFMRGAFRVTVDR